MTREEAINSIIGADPAQNFPVMASDDVEILVHKIFNDHEAQLKAKDEEIEALQSRSCDTCEYDGTLRYLGKDSKCTRCCNFFSSRYVPKDTK